MGDAQYSRYTLDVIRTTPLRNTTPGSQPIGGRSSITLLILQGYTQHFGSSGTPAITSTLEAAWQSTSIACPLEVYFCNSILQQIHELSHYHAVWYRYTRRGHAACSCASTTMHETHEEQGVPEVFCMLGPSQWAGHMIVRGRCRALYLRKQVSIMSPNPRCDYCSGGHASKTC